MNRLTLPAVGALLALSCAGSSAELGAAQASVRQYRHAVRGDGSLPPPAPRALIGQPPLSASAASSRRPRLPTRIDAADRSVLRERYPNAVQVHAWSEGALYRLHTAPERVSDIVLEPGETLVSVAAGDTARWIIGDTTSGSGAGRRTHILVKPSAAGLRTNLVIATDRRVYHLQVESSARTATASIAWTYPDDALLALRGGQRAQPPEGPAAGNVALDTLNFGYTIQGDKPQWRPVRAFDDGQQVFIEFPAGLSQAEAPPLFVLGQSGRPELVNYRMRGRYYIVDRLFSTAELRLGERRQQVVRIVRSGSEQRRTRRGRAS